MCDYGIKGGGLMTEKGFAEKIAELRKSKLLSQKELGEMLGISNKAVSKWERGESMPQMKTIVKLAEIFEISPEELLTGSKYDVDKDNKPEQDEKLNILESENQRLRRDLAGANSKSKKVFGIAAIICTVLVAVVIILVLNAQQQSSNPNDSIKSFGKEGTAIEFCGERFVPANVLEQELYGDDYFYYYDDDGKYATFIDENNNQSRILVTSDSVKYVVVEQKQKQPYVYVNEKNRLKIDVDSISQINFHKKTDDLYAYSAIRSTVGKKYFVKYYDEKTVAKNADAITKQYMGKDSFTVEVELEEEYRSLQIGELFSDKDSNLYFYDYLTAKTYVMGGDLFEYATNY